MTTIQRYHRLRHEYDHYERRQKMLHSILTQKRDELENLMNHINLLEDKLSVDHKTEPSICIYDHGDHPTMPPLFSLENLPLTDDDEESDNDPLLQRLKLTKPSRLKTSSRQITTIHFNDSISLDEIHTVYDEYLSE
jgi:hypothetical protein